MPLVIKKGSFSFKRVKSRYQQYEHPEANKNVSLILLVAKHGRFNLMYIEKVSVKNYKSLLELKDLYLSSDFNVIVGPNSSGAGILF